MPQRVCFQFSNVKGVHLLTKIVAWLWYGWHFQTRLQPDIPSALTHLLQPFHQTLLPSDKSLATCWGSTASPDKTKQKHRKKHYELSVNHQPGQKETPHSDSFKRKRFRSVINTPKKSLCESTNPSFKNSCIYQQNSPLGSFPHLLLLKPIFHLDPPFPPLQFLQVGLGHLG